MVKRGHRGSGLKHQKEKRSMDHFAGLDVSVNETSICIVDGAGRIVRETKVASEPEALLAALKNAAYHTDRLECCLHCTAFRVVEETQGIGQALSRGRY